MGTLEQVQGELTEGVEVGRCVSAADAALIVPAGDIEDPAQAVLDAPMSTDSVREGMDMGNKDCG